MGRTSRAGLTAEVGVAAARRAAIIRRRVKVPVSSGKRLPD